MSKRSWYLSFITVLSIFLTSTNVSARATSASVDRFLPALDPGPYLTVYGSQTIQPWRYQFGAYFDFAKNPLEVGLGGVRRAGVVDNLFIMHAFGSLGLTDWMHMSLAVPVAFYDDFNDPIAGTSSQAAAMGDIRFETKLRILDIDRHHFGIAFMPFLLAPTGSGSKYVGNNSFAGGAKIIFDTHIKNRVQIAANFGYMARDRVTIFNTLQDDQFSYGLGIGVKTWEWLDLITEMTGTTNVTNFFGNQAETPLEVDAGLRFNLPKPEGLAVTVGGGFGLTFGYGTPDFRTFLGLTYPNPKRVYLPVEEPLASIVQDKIVITKAIHFEFDRAVIRPVSFPILDAVVDIMKAHSDVRKVRVEGHTDSKGSDPYNMRLSQRRVNAVREYMVSHGISGDRLIAVGYGETRPIASNDTDEGRAKNRRVEFTILEQEGHSSPSE